MALYAKLCWQEEPHIPTHAFQAALNEVVRLKISTTDIQNFFGLTAAEKTEVDDLITKMNLGLILLKEVDDILLLADSQFPGYDTESVLKTRLGISIL